MNDVVFRETSLVKLGGTENFGGGELPQEMSRLNTVGAPLGTALLQHAIQFLPPLKIIHSCQMFQGIFKRYLVSPSSLTINRLSAPPIHA